MDLWLRGQLIDNVDGRCVDSCDGQVLISTSHHTDLSSLRQAVVVERGGFSQPFNDPEKPHSNTVVLTEEE